MTTTALRMPRPVHRDGEVLHQRIAVAPRSGDALPCAEDASRVRAIRRIAAARLRSCGLEALSTEVALIVSELLTNALMHSGTTEITLHLGLQDGFLHVTVIDGMPGHAARKPTTDDAESGRGLALVQAVASENGGTWGTSKDGAETWCSLRVPSKERP
ncbi:ATP-binding protein [Streptomyces cadmiisoli]|uniref:ATP-binding protein n=1 Tax=Streptomyces cadmiisoli TaxID=2184053 RepID=A0A2Z4JDI4_9ACTN|nr:ATP-binding protein [Streptomyces cadmiisoli]